MANERFSVVRPADLLVLDVELVNLVIDGQRLERADREQPALVLFHLPPQHVIEAPIVFSDAVPRPVPAFVAGPSRLTISLNNDVTGLDLSMAGLLTWAPELVTALGVPRSISHDPGDVTSFLGMPRTAVEFPARLVLSHEGDGEWRHRAEPFTADGRTEVWHTRLVPADGTSLEVNLRAYARYADRPARPGMLPDDGQLEDILLLVNTEELPPPVIGPLLEAADRAGISHDLAMQLFQEAWPSGDTFRAEPLLAERFMLTPLGASVRMRGQWNYPDARSHPAEFEHLLRALGMPTPGVEHYHHVTGLGRDQYVRVVERGHLHTGHRAAITAIHERVFDTDEKGWPVAALVRRTFITVQEPEVAYEGRELPFTSLRITNLVTPQLADVSSTRPFWIQVESGADHLFTVIGTDPRGRQVTFTLPAIFIPAGTTLPDSLYHEGPEERRTRPMNNQLTALADDGGTGTTSFPVAGMTLDLPQGGPPTMKSADIRVPAIEELTGSAGVQTVQYLQGYLDDGLEHVSSGAFLQMAQSVGLAMGAEQVGGVARPDAVVDMISSRGGALSKAFAGDRPSIDEILAMLGDNATLLGSVKLKDVLADIVGDLTPDAFPTELTEEQRNALFAGRQPLLPAPILRTTRLADGSGTELQYLWKPGLKSAGLEGVARLDLDRAWLVLDAKVLRGTNGAVTTTVTGTLRRFAFDFADIARVDFDELTFTSRPGAKPDVKASGIDITFQKDLQFVNQIREMLPKDCFGDGSVVAVTPTGITAGYTLAIPTFQVGIFSMQNLALSALLTIPFDDRPARLRFAISERHNPFGLTVSVFGGGGFFALEVSTRGVELVEGALEFGGSVALNLGVASGGVYLMGGIYFALTGTSATVRGYVRAGGYLSVLGIISVSVEFYLALEYQKTQDANGNPISVLRGQGSVTVSVRVLFFSKTVSLTMEKSFEGSPGDPTFEDCVEPADWDDYCLAFAA